ncbi:unnamed protein product, partial [marine sediment metagenome]
MSTLPIPKIKEFINEWDTKKGLFYNIHIFFITFAVLEILIYFQLISLDNAKSLFLIPNLAFLFLWIFKRSYLNLNFSKKINIVFALDLENKSSRTLKIYRETIENLKMKILESSLENIIKVSEKPKDIKFKSKKAAEVKTEMGLRGSVLVVWGNIIESSQKYKLFFSYQFGYPGREEEFYKRIFMKKVDKVLAKKLWSYAGPNSVELASQDLLEVV